MKFLKRRYLLLVDLLILISTIVIVCLIYNSYQPELSPTPEVTIQHSVPEYSIQTTIYIDRAFTTQERTYIAEAAHEWVKATKGIIEYNIIQLPVDGPIRLDNCLFISKLSPDDPTVILSDSLGATSILAYYNTKDEIPTISVVEGRIPDKQYKNIIMHELGHSLGLEHQGSFNDIGTLMYPYVYIHIGSLTIDTTYNKISFRDLVQFCTLYYCNPNELVQ